VFVRVARVFTRVCFPREARAHIDVRLLIAGRRNYQKALEEMGSTFSEWGSKPDVNPGR